ncbi:hypothetical protein CLCR_06482 [Cladophialophora carrionii]|uniref:Uncharacterized protein n=1 Tax=Cladophialophora carrionii TaxID=86049 RepID=A0A1C1C727_9EURO|nr:hypothetical protein CLCR_06482 [Cladophialophora carrionii]
MMKPDMSRMAHDPKLAGHKLLLALAEFGEPGETFAHMYLRVPVVGNMSSRGFDLWIWVFSSLAVCAAPSPRLPGNLQEAVETQDL